MICDVYEALEVQDDDPYDAHDAYRALCDQSHAVRDDTSCNARACQSDACPSSCAYASSYPFQDEPLDDL